MTQLVGIPEASFRAIADYIVGQPYKDVAGLVEAIKAAKIVTVSEEKPPEAPSDDKQ